MSTLVRLAPHCEHEGRAADGSAPFARLRAEKRYAEIGRADAIAGAIGLRGGTAGQHEAGGERDEREARRADEQGTNLHERQAIR